MTAGKFHQASASEVPPPSGTAFVSSSHTCTCQTVGGRAPMETSHAPCRPASPRLPCLDLPSLKTVLMTYTTSYHVVLLVLAYLAASHPVGPTHPASSKAPRMQSLDGKCCILVYSTKSHTCSRQLQYTTVLVVTN